MTCPLQIKTTFLQIVQWHLWREWYAMEVSWKISLERIISISVLIDIVIMGLVIMTSGLIISMSCHILVVGLWAILTSWCSVSMSVWFTIGRKFMDIYTKWCNLLPMSKTPRSCAKISRYRITNMIVKLTNFWLESCMVWGGMNITFTWQQEWWKNYLVAMAIIVR
jgi:hypothetical protein